MITTGTYDGFLIFLSVLIAIFAAFTALSLASRVRASSGWTRRIWLAAAAIALGGGIWSMHFVAMLAFSMPKMQMNYDLPLTMLSLGFALAFTGAGFAVMDWEVVARRRTVAAGLLMGSGILGMHYLGMSAMRMAATLSYDSVWIAVSVLIAMGAASAAVHLASREQEVPHRLLAAGVMGIAIAGMHYTGMHAAIFTVAVPADLVKNQASLGQAYLAILVAAITVLILLIGLGAARLENVFQAVARREARVALRLKVADVLRGRRTEEALEEVAALMGAHFGVSRAGYGQLDPSEDMFDYDVCWTNGVVPPLLGRFPAAAFGVKIVAALTAGETVVVSDLLHADLSDEVRTRETAKKVDTRAILVVPFVRDGRLRTIVYLNDAVPRIWLREDIAFMEEIAERTRLVIERASVEEQLRILNATLEERVEARTLELRQTQDALLQSQKMEAIGQLVSGLSHDFNNVLGAIVGAFELVRRQAHDPDRVHQFAEAGLQAAGRGAKLTAQLLAFSRSQRIQLQPIFVCDVIGELRELLERTLGPMIRLEHRLNPTPVPVLSDPTQVEMMVLNLAINARDAMPDGGTLVIGTEVCSIFGDHEVSDGEYVEISVCDSGFGMDEATLRRAMEPFFTTKPVGKGTGLGLAQIYGSARQAGGTVRIQSAPGAGTTVRVLLPCTRLRPRAAARAGSTATIVQRSPAKVLLVDDDHDLRGIVASALQAHGNQVVEASDGASALAALAADAPDVAVIDFAMPEMNGAQLAHRIAERWPGLPVLFATGFADTDAIEAAVGHGAIMLRKPFRIVELLDAVDDLLTRAR